jgi:hypothetical protein
LLYLERHEIPGRPEPCCVRSGIRSRGPGQGTPAPGEPALAWPSRRQMGTRTATAPCNRATAAGKVECAAPAASIKSAAPAFVDLWAGTARYRGWHTRRLPCAAGSP